MTDAKTVPIIEEELNVSKRSVRKATVRIETATSLVDELVSASLQSDDVEVVRVPIGQEVEHAPPVRTEGDTTIVPVLEEVLIIQKRLVLKEELHITRRVTTDHVEIPVTLRKQNAAVSRSGD